MGSLAGHHEVPIRAQNHGTIRCNNNVSKLLQLQPRASYYYTKKPSLDQ